MLTLVFNNRKCLTLNLSKEPNFVLTSLLKFLHYIYTSQFLWEICPKKPALLLHSRDFRTRHQVLTCVFFSTV